MELFAEIFSGVSLLGLGILGLYLCKIASKRVPDARLWEDWQRRKQRIRNQRHGVSCVVVMLAVAGCHAQVPPATKGSNVALTWTAGTYGTGGYVQYGYPTEIQ